MNFLFIPFQKKKKRSKLIDEKARKLVANLHVTPLETMTISVKLFFGTVFEQYEDIFCSIV